MPEQFNGIFKNKRVLITGHTGFKGSWLSLWLLELGAKVSGYSLNIPTTPSSFKILNLENKLTHIKGDIRNKERLESIFKRYAPEVIFHLAAQSLAPLSYDIPLDTFNTNVAGTLNILECIRKYKSVKAAVIITSDKCYQNVEWIWGYRENDRLGGDDPYSASKACAEIAVHCYIKTFFSQNDSAHIATARAGNVIGGGDWAADRIIPDCVRAFSRNKKLKIRNPHATRPWQHVFEPLSGYLWLAANLLKNSHRISRESFNFGPSGQADRPVKELIKEFSKTFCEEGKYILNRSLKKESGFLRLNCDKALNYLKWHTALGFAETVRLTADWYRAFYAGKTDMHKFSVKQLEGYIRIAKQQGLPWVGK